MKIGFVFPPGMVGGRPLDFHNLWTDPRGLTGSESSILIFAKELAKRGHDVSLFIENPNAPAFDNVKLVQLSELPTVGPGFHVVCSWIYCSFLMGLPASVFRVCSQTCNSFDYEPHHFEDSVDIFLSPSEHHMRYMRKWTLTAENRWKTLRLGCYPDDYEWDCEFKKPGRVVYISSPDRGLHLLLQEWPAIRKAVPDAHLKIFYYALDVYLNNYFSKFTRDAEATLDNIEHGARARYIAAALKRLEGIEVVGSVSRETLRKELSQARVLAYPCETTSYSEGFSVSTLEGCASGALPILAECDALGHVYRGVIPMVPAPAHKHMTAWRELVVRALTDEPWRELKATRARDFALGHDYKDITADLERIFQDGVDAKRAPVTLSTRNDISLDFVLTEFASGGPDPIAPEAPKESRGGGSRIGCMKLARAIAKRGGYNVRMFSRFTHEANVDGVHHLQPTALDPNAPRDAVFAYYDMSPLSAFLNVGLRIASHHGYVPPVVGFTNWADVNTAPTEHAVDALRTAFDPHGTWYVLPNGVDDPFINWQPVPGRVLYHTSPDRGLHVLLKLWPKIRAAVPEATLHVTGDVPACAWHDVPLSAVFSRSVPGRRVLALRQGIVTARAAGGVEFIGKVSSDLLRHEMGQASCFAYPCSVLMPCETFSVCVMECMQAGIPVVLSPADSLGFYFDMAVVTPSPVEEHEDEFADAVVRVLKSRPLRLSCRYMGNRFAVRYTFDRMAAVLDSIIRKHLP